MTSGDVRPGDFWYIKDPDCTYTPGPREIVEAEVLDVSTKTIQITYRKGQIPTTKRYLIEEIDFIERMPI